jgi:hypothetical protein
MQGGAAILRQYRESRVNTLMSVFPDIGLTVDKFNISML